MLLDLEFVCEKEPPADHVRAIRLALGTDIEFRALGAWLADLESGGFGDVSYDPWRDTPGSRRCSSTTPTCPPSSRCARWSARWPTNLALFAVNRQYRTSYAFTAVREAA